MMREKDFGFLKMSSRLVKISAWTFFLFGIIQAAAIFTRLEDKAISAGIGFLWAAVSAAIFFTLYLISQSADLLLEIWQFLKKERF
jgi:hypothetical protein